MGKSPRDTGGPIVKTGPTAGKNRSRNKDGSWRKKRSDSGKSKKSGGCFLTTAACEYKGLGDNCHELEVLRDFRDQFLLPTNEGQALVEHYYKVAPEILKRISTNSEFQGIWKVIESCVSHVEGKNPEAALAEYIAMVKSLEARYLQEKA